MRKLAVILASLVMLLLSFQTALAATCTLNGEVVPCDQIPRWLFLLPLTMIPVGLMCFVFWLLMLLDAINHQKEDRTMWVLLIVFLGILGAIIYYFSQKRPRKNSPSNS